MNATACVHANWTFKEHMGTWGLWRCDACGLLEKRQARTEQELQHQREVDVVARSVRRLKLHQHLASSEMLSVVLDNDGLKELMRRANLNGVWWGTLLEQHRHAELCSHISSVVMVLQSIETAIVSLTDTLRSIDKTTVYVRGEPK